LGDTGFMTARLVGETGRVIITDFAPEMVAAARQRAEELGVENTEFRVLDAERMDLETDGVDGVRCRWGYMLKIDPAACCGQDVD
jgi:ubiquinone/menaquinone biosynthesis C-methylase UbiE